MTVREHADDLEMAQIFDRLLAQPALRAAGVTESMTGPDPVRCQMCGIWCGTAAMPGVALSDTILCRPCRWIKHPYERTGRPGATNRLVSGWWWISPSRTIVAIKSTKKEDGTTAKDVLSRVPGVEVWSVSAQPEAGWMTEAWWVTGKFAKNLERPWRRWGMGVAGRCAALPVKEYVVRMPWETWERLMAASRRLVTREKGRGEAALIQVMDWAWRERVARSGRRPWGEGQEEQPARRRTVWRRWEDVSVDTREEVEEVVEQLARVTPPELTAITVWREVLRLSLDSVREPATEETAVTLTA